MNHKFTSANRTFRALLGSLILLFICRVAGQFIQLVYPVPWLPELSHWQGSAAPYWMLLTIQLAIIAVMVKILRDHLKGTIVKSKRKGKWLLIFGSLYFLSMAIRFAVGLSGLSALPWFQKVIPAFFHLVLASFVLLLGAYHAGKVAEVRLENA